MQDREGAAFEIARLRSKIERLEAQGKAQASRVASERPAKTEPEAPRPFRAGPSVLRRREVESLTGLSRSTIYHYVKNGEFPKPVALGPRAVGWLESAVSEWIAQRVKIAHDDRRQPA
jgi:prophage regulatory protein